MTTHYAKTRSNIVDLSRRLAEAEIPWKHMGRNLFGLDCIGQLVWTALQIGMQPVDCCDYSEQPDGRLLEYLDQNLVRQADIKTWGPSDVLAFWVDPGTKKPQHVGVALPEGRFVHSLRNVGKIVETDLARWRRRVVAVYQWPDLEG